MVIFSFNGCAVKAKKTDVKFDGHRYVIGKKSFADEDEYILKGLYYAQKKDYLKTAKIFGELYSKSLKELYLVEALKLIYHSGQFASDEAKSILTKSSKVMNRDDELKRMVAVFYLYQDKLNKSEKLALELLKEDKTIKNYHLIAIIKKQNIKNGEN